MTIGQLLKSLRKERNLNLVDVEKATSIGKSSISEYENDKVSPSIDNLAILAKFYEVSTDYLLGVEKKYEFERTAFHTTSVDGLDEDDVMLVENLIKSLKEKHKK